MVGKVQNTQSIEKSSTVAATVATAAPKRAPKSASSAPADSVTAGGTASVAVVNEAAPATGANPFDALLAAAASVPAAELRLVAGGEATSESCEPTLATLALLAELESRVSPRDAWGPTKVRNGYMQVTYDAQEERVAASLVDRDGSEELARVLVERPTSAKEIIQAQEWRGAAGGYFKGGDVNAFVQQVLRECYLLGMTDLQLYGDRLKALNELKKKIREEADRARKVKSEWATAAKADANWVSGTAYETVKVDSAQIALVPGAYTTANAATPPAGPAPEQGDSTAVDPFFAEGSGLGTNEGAAEAIAMYDGYSIAHRYLADLEALIPSMNANDVQTYLLPILHKLADGKHHGSIARLFGSMTDEQVMMAVADGISSDNLDDFEGREFGDFVARVRGAQLGLMPDAPHVDGSLITQEEAGALWSAYVAERMPKPASNGELSQQRLSARRDGMMRREIGALTAAPSPAPANTIDTVAEMEDYLKYLEEQMNSVGDDAQLANIDLQNCLQKQQQTLQMMSNISKVLHDVGMAIIRNMNS